MIGILGGTFDPVHNGHLGIARDAQSQLGLAEVRFIPLYQAVHKDQPATSASLRLQILNEALDGQEDWIADDREIRRGGDSYMVDTLASLHNEFPDQALCLILGTDAYNHFLSWKEPEKIASLCHLVVLKRPGYQPPDDKELNRFTTARIASSADRLRESSSGKVYFMSINPQEISSSKIRSLVAQNRPIDAYCPENVVKTIDSERLYSNP